MIKWNNFKYMRKNLILLVIGYAFITSYQFIAVFLDRRKSAFFGYTTIFLSLNCMIVIFIIYLNHGVIGASMSEFMATRLKQG